MYYRARYYDPELERFISDDPLGDAQRYMSGNPLRYNDPMGLNANDFFAGVMDTLSTGLTQSLRGNGNTAFGPVSQNEDYMGGQAAAIYFMIHPEVRVFTYSCALARGARAAMAAAQQANTLNRNVKWTLGAFKSEVKWANQMKNRGWTSEKITEAISRGKAFTPVKPNYINPGNPTMGFIHP